MPCPDIKKYAPMKKSFEKEYGKEKGDEYFYAKLKKMGVHVTKKIKIRKIKS